MLPYLFAYLGVVAILAVGIAFGWWLHSRRTADYKARWQEAVKLIHGEGWRIEREAVRGEYQAGEFAGQSIDTYKLVVTNGAERYVVDYRGKPGRVFNPLTEDPIQAAADYYERAEQLLEAVSRAEASP